MYIPPSIFIEFDIYRNISRNFYNILPFELYFWYIYIIEIKYYIFVRQGIILSFERVKFTFSLIFVNHLSGKERNSFADK